MRASLSLVVALSCAALLVAQQPNSAAATMTIGGANGPPYPIATEVRTNTTVTIALSGPANAPWILAVSPTGLVQPGALLTGGGILDLPSAPLITLQSVLDASGHASFGVSVPQAGVPPLMLPLGHHEALQAAIINPLAPAGFTLTAATQITLTQGPITVNLSLGDEGVAAIPLSTYGFALPFYGITYSQLWMSANGFLTFDGPDPDSSPSVFDFNAGKPKIAPFWSDLAQGAGTIRYTVDPMPPAGQPRWLKAEWINVVATWPNIQYNFSAYLDETGECRLSYSTVNGQLFSNTLCGIGPGFSQNPQASKDLSALYLATYPGGTNEGIFEFFQGFGFWPGPVPSPNPIDLYGLTLHFTPLGPGSQQAYFLH
jgi:hypothetical protein